MKRFVLLSAAVTALAACAAFAQPAAPEGAKTKMVPWLTIYVKDYGKIVVELFPDSAPRNVANIESLAQKGFYNGLTFHRVVPDFVIQGGDPKGDGTGGPDYTVPAEIRMKHVRGALAMARTENPAKASSSCQFYICLQALPQLDGNYTVIGLTRQGMEVVDSIAKAPRDDNDKPLRPVVIDSIVVSMAEPTGQPAATPKVANRLFMNIEFKDYGNVKIELFPNDAPKNVSNVETLAKRGFYDGLTIHRIVPGFVIQGGDPKGDGSGGLGYTVPAEIKLKHVRGAVAMARLGDNVNPSRASSSCQFYICLSDLPQLDGQYTVIGQVASGMDVVDKIAAVETSDNEKPVTPVIMTKVTIEEQKPSKQ
jgi:cyclophilin family peptidyl-prolyl cis-trans isomerase